MTRWKCNQCGYRTFKEEKFAQQHANESGHKVRALHDGSAITKDNFGIVDTVPVEDEQFAPQNEIEWQQSWREFTPGGDVGGE